MEFKIIWSDGAVADLEDICKYIAWRNAEAARRIAQGILDHIAILGSFPLIGPNYPPGARGTLREIVFRSCHIFYDVNRGRPNRASVDVGPSMRSPCASKAIQSSGS